MTRLGMVSQSTLYGLVRELLALNKRALGSRLCTDLVNAVWVLCLRDQRFETADQRPETRDKKAET